ncbi:MAG TPA: hypothetical protein VFZ16_05070 [Hyphomicrobiaceae bacterium]|nr:hypothetical protein [Hyphomicrobiaceae bacterium]
MPVFTIETTYRLPAYRQRTYEAGTIEEACRLAIEDDDWSGQEEDYDASGEMYVSGVWPGEDTAYRVTALVIPSQFAEAQQRKADHFAILLGLLKIIARAGDAAAPASQSWCQSVEAAIAKAEAILAGARDPA